MSVAAVMLMMRSARNRAIGSSMNGRKEQVHYPCNIITGDVVYVEDNGNTYSRTATETIQLKDYDILWKWVMKDHDDPGDFVVGSSKNVYLDKKGHVG